MKEETVLRNARRMTHNQFINWANTRSYADVADIKAIASRRGLILDDFWSAANGKQIMTAAERSKILAKQTARTTNMLERTVASQQAMLSRTIREMEMKIISKTKALIADGRNLAGMNVNLKQLQAVHKDLVNIFEHDYPDAIRTVVSGFDDVALFVQENYRSLNMSATFTGTSREMIKALKSGTYDGYYRFGQDTTERLRETMYSHVLAGGDYGALVASIQGIMTGLVDVRGRPLTNYTNTYAFDSVMNFHNGVNMKLAEEAGLTSFRYSGNIINTSRNFCRNIVGQTFTKEEIESWDGDDWQGKAGPPLIYRGGYNCRHHWVATDPKWTEGEKPPELPPKPPPKPPKPKPKTPRPKPKPKQVARKPSVPPVDLGYTKGQWVPSYKQRRVWEEVDNIDDARAQFKNKFSIDEMRNDKAIPEADKTTMYNVLGKQSADMFAANPGLQKFAELKPINQFGFYQNQSNWVKILKNRAYMDSTKGIMGVHTGWDDVFIKARGGAKKLASDAAKDLAGKRPIELGKFSFTDSTLDIWRHEYGHHIHEIIKNNFKQIDNEWKAIFRNHFWEEGEYVSLPKEIASISEYACYNYKEMFAESFSLFTNRGYKMGMLPKDIEDFFVKHLSKLGD